MPTAVPGSRTRRTLVLALALVLALMPYSSAGAGWVEQREISPGGIDPEWPNVVLAPDGTATAVWRDDAQSGENQLVWVTRPPGGQWSAPAPVPGTEPFPGSTTQLDVSADGHVALSWIGEDSAGNRRVQASVKSPGAGWSAATWLTGVDAEVRSPDVASVGGGAVVVAWEHGFGEQPSRIRTRARSTTGAWEPGVWLTPAGPEAGTEPHLDAADDGTVVAVWILYSSSRQTAQTATRTSAGVWSPVVDLSAPTERVGSVRAAIAPQGAAIVAWNQLNPAQVKVRTRAVGEAWSSSVSLGSDVSNALTPMIGVSADDSATAVWAVEDAEDRLRLVASHRSPSGAWSSPQTVSDSAEDIDDPSLGVGPGGFAILIAQVDDPLTTPVQRMGGAQFLNGVWSPWEVLSGTEAGAYPGVVAVDGAGDALGVWTASGPDELRIVARPFDRNPPVIEVVQVPSAIAGVPVEMSVSARDTWSGAQAAAWDFGDGQAATGATVAHTYPSPGSYPVTVTVADGAGNPATAQAQVSVTVAPGPPPPTKPSVGSLIAQFKLKPPKLNLSGTNGKKRVRAVLVLADDARVTLRFKAIKGRATKVKRAGGKKGALRIALKRELEAGRSTVRVAARIKKRRLLPGVYRVTAIARHGEVKDKAKVRLRVVR